MMLSRPSEPPDERILLVTIDEKDVQRYSNPFPDETVNQLLKKTILSTTCYWFKSQTSPTK